uniref:Uncharacterized protein n=1 Tax=Parascaris equorum TaxID=6256 RepID=A0A914RS11_PAREQ
MLLEDVANYPCANEQLMAINGTTASQVLESDAFVLDT